MRNAWVALSMISRANRNGYTYFAIYYGGFESRTHREVVVASAVVPPSEWRAAPRDKMF